MALLLLLRLLRPRGRLQRPEVIPQPTFQDWIGGCSGTNCWRIHCCFCILCSNNDKFQTLNFS